MQEAESEPAQRFLRPRGRFMFMHEQGDFTHAKHRYYQAQQYQESCYRIINARIGADHTCIIGMLTHTAK